MTKMKIGIVSGYFDPLHNGHIELFLKSREKCDKLVVILNNDLQTSMKKGKPFMDENVRKIIVEAIRYVDEVFLSIDKKRSVCESLKAIKEKYIDNEVIFFNGGDQNQETIPEYKTCKEIGIKMMDGFGEKINSSKNYYNK